MALNEAKVLSMLDHNNIISYYDCFEQVCCAKTNKKERKNTPEGLTCLLCTQDGTLQIEMEYADGGSLAQLLQNYGELFCLGF